LRIRKEEEMRVYVLGFLGALGLAVSFQTAGATPLGLGSIVVAPVSKSVPAATHNCGKGQRWVPAGYAKHGKYRAGHCAPS
jgi:hypothetical protein